MKMIKQEVKTYKAIYVSVDGKEFDNEADCKAWEKSYKGTLEASWKLIKKIEVSDCALGLPWSSDDHECYVLKPKNLDEITLLNAYIESSTCSKGLLTAQHIGELIVLNFGYDHDYCDVYELADHLKSITEYIGRMNEKINELV
jgi:hypothetical protein